MPPFRTKTGKAFTLVEMLLYMGMVGLLLTSVSLTYYVTIRSRVKNETVADVDAIGRSALERINRTIRNANAITAPSIGANQSSLTLAVPDSAKNPTVFSLSSGRIMMQEGSDPAVALTPARMTVTALTFQNLGRSGTEGIIRTAFTIARANVSLRNEYQYSKDFAGSAGIR